MKRVLFIMACTILGIAVANFTLALLAMLRHD